MKNVTIALDDETHRKARIRAAELGTSLSALVKNYLNGLVDGTSVTPAGGVRDVQTHFQGFPVDDASFAPPTGREPPYVVNGKKVWTKDGKPRKPGAMRGKYPPVELADLDTPDWMIDLMEGSEDDFSDPLPFDESQLPSR
jgi:hypothetical protein